MKKIVLIFGVIAGLITGGMFYLNIPEPGETMSFEGGAIIGYVTMIIALSSIFFAVKQYRDKYNGGSIKFGKAFLIGLYITLIASVIYVLLWEVYYNAYASDFGDQYVEYLKKQMIESGKSEADISVEMAEMEKSMESYKNNRGVRFAFTFIEIFPVGLIISLICGVLFGVFMKPKANDQDAVLS
ncbi:MAG: DUF4199 domain-containing protein [Bacteroidota bacterium]